MRKPMSTLLQIALGAALGLLVVAVALGAALGWQLIPPDALGGLDDA